MVRGRSERGGRVHIHLVRYALGCAGFGKHNKSLLYPSLQSGVHSHIPLCPSTYSPPTLMENLLEHGPSGNPFSFGKYLREKLKFDSERSYRGRSILYAHRMCGVCRYDYECAVGGCSLPSFLGGGGRKPALGESIKIREESVDYTTGIRTKQLFQ
ncbi:unnamed protein product [Danaus chrysippus]|uniref:(African queen) hypothetical protein n=1 Tax=Danaus chrysippus TaxID=151541 RepID=A0A8J2VZI7_9NEOP|nr:unnamed protein product [Danaus chrysippus]